MTERLRTLSLWQPWASLVMAGAKPFEFRGKPPPRTIIGKRIVIHATVKKIDRNECLNMLRLLKMNEGAELCLKPEQAIPVLEKALDRSPDLMGHGDLPWGAGLGTVMVGAGRDGLVIARNEFGVDHVDVGELNANWGWPMSDPEPWDMPVPAKGQQGIWFWPQPGDAGL